jgi:hypothetical protein
MIYFKAFDRNLKCRSYQFEIGKTFIEDIEPKLCSKGFHFCYRLTDTFKYYSKFSSRVCIIKPSGKILKGDDKCCSNQIEIVRELTEDEIKHILQLEGEENYHDLFRISTVKTIQKKFPEVIIGGSVSLYLQGYKLNRKKGQVDLDLITPYYINMSGEDDDLDIQFVEGKKSGNDYSESLLINCDGCTTKADVRVDNKTKYNLVTVDNFTFKVCDLMTTLEAKCRYAMEGNIKHRDDVLSLMTKIDITGNKLENYKLSLI